MSHPIPDDVLIDHLAVLAKTGAGKTYMAKGLVERLLSQKRRVCIVDPKNAWWGLKSSADGKSPAFPIVVFGGPKADVPLLATHGKVLGEAIATGHLSCIICTKEMPESERIRFLTDLFQTLNIKNSEPLHLILDEAHMMAPQKPLGEMQRLTHWTSELVSGGRGMGFRVMLLSQRPARLNKDVLTQCEALVAMRMTGPQDRDAVRNWIHDQADVAKGKEIVASLPTLQNGEGWFWAPAQDILKRVKFPLITTYDNSKTKRDSKADDKAELAPVDLSALQDKLGKVKAEIEANDPKALQRQVAELQKQLRAKTPAAAPVADLVHERSVAYNAGYAAAAKEGTKQLEAAAKSFLAVSAMLDKAKALIPAFVALPAAAPPKEHKIVTGMREAVAHAKRTPPAAPAAGVTRPQQKVLDALAWWAARGKDAPTIPMIAVIAGYRPSSGGPNNIVSELVTAGLAMRPGPNFASLTDSGASVAASPERASALESARAVMTAPQRKMFDVLAEAYPDEMAVVDTGVGAGYSETSGGPNNLISELVTLSFVTRPRPNFTRAADWLFEVHQ